MRSRTLWSGLGIIAGALAVRELVAWLVRSSTIGSANWLASVWLVVDATIGLGLVMLALVIDRWLAGIRIRRLRSQGRDRS